MANAPKVRVTPTAQTDGDATKRQDQTAARSKSASVVETPSADSPRSLAAETPGGVNAAGEVDPTDVARAVDARDATDADGERPRSIGADQGSSPGSGTPSAWLTRHFPGHEHMAAGAACGLAIALLVFAIGFFRTLILAVLVSAGAAVGQFLDGDRRIVDLIRQMVSERRG